MTLKGICHGLPEASVSYTHLGVPPERVSLQPRNMSPGKIEAYGSQRFHSERDGNNILDEPVYRGNATVFEPERYLRERLSLIHI